MTQHNPRSIRDQLFSNDFFKNSNTTALVKQFDISANLRKAYAVKKTAAPLVALTTTVITSILPEGISIITSGQYQFANDITWSPMGPGSAITITADNLLLDLKGFTFTVNIPQNSLVMDPELKVPGISDLRLIDASVAPTPVTGNAAGVSYVIGAKVAQLLKKRK